MKLILFFLLAVVCPGSVMAAPKPAEAASHFLQNGVTAHRGGAAEVPENTMVAFRHAIALGVDWVELDIFFTRDRQIVVSHDATTKRMGDRELRLAAHTYAELKGVDVAAEFRRKKGLTETECPRAEMPLLSEVLALFQTQRRTRVSLQPKDGSTAAALELVRAMKAEPWVGFNDGDLAKMTLVKQTLPDVPVFWDRPAKCDLDRDLAIAKERGFAMLVLERRGISPEVIQRVHAAGLPIGAWTVNDPAEMGRFRAWGIDRLYTDLPTTLLALPPQS